MAISDVRFATSEIAAARGASAVPLRVLLQPSFVQAASYSDSVRELTVVLEGGTYVFEGVSRRVFEALVHAPSVGSFFNNFIRPNYDNCRLDAQHDGRVRQRLMFA